jgi:protein-S-isoprenylcysteine O-methyltransferase Ste14
MVPTWVSALALVALVAGVQMQVRAVEEPYLRAVHGAAYDAYAARTGRFVPGIGHRTAPTPVTDQDHRPV